MLSNEAILYYANHENVSKDNPDYDFLKLNTGIKKMIQDGGHVVDVSGTGGMDLEMFYNW